MQKSEQLLKYLQQGVQELLERGTFEGGQNFRLVQRDALRALNNFLHDERLSPEKRVNHYFEIAAGLGKTALFAGIIGAAYKAGQKDGKDLTFLIVVPTIRIFNQVKSAIGEYSPSLSDQIALYGAGKKETQKPIMLMTSKAWVEMSKGERLRAEDISIFDVDCLVLDEVHTATSDPRVNLITNIFSDAGTGILGLTATAHYDKKKTVDLFHEGRRVFGMGMKEGVESGQSAAYINTRLDTLRIDPPTKEQIQVLKKMSNGHHSIDSVLKRVKWNEWAIAHFKGSRDEMTGDLLSDNIAGFFVSGIPHANHLEKMLNSDLALQQKAAARGHKGVAVAIHSHMSPEEQERRLRKYESGQCMALVGDKMFKEGYDFPPMKTIFNWQRGSQLEEAQFIGRGNRKWWNSTKRRWEGLTVYEAMTYIGSTDPKKDAKIEEGLLEKITTASDVAGGTIILGPGKEIPPQHSRKKTIAPAIKIDGATITAHATFRDSQIIRTKRKKRQKGDNLVKISNADRADLIAHHERTGLGGNALFKKIADPPEGLDGTIAGAIVSGTKNSAVSAHVQAMLDTYALQSENRLIPLLASDKRRMHNQMKRTKGLALIFKRDDVPERLKYQAVKNWPRPDGPETVAKNNWNWVMGSLKGLPTLIQITPEMRVFVQNQFERTGTSERLIPRYFKKLPEGLTKDVIRHLVDPKSKKGTISQTHWKWLERTLKKMPDVMETDQAKRDELEHQIERTSVSLDSILRGFPAYRIPGGYEGFHHLRMKGWRSGMTKSTDPELWNMVMSSYLSLPIKMSIPFDDLDKIRAEVTRTGVDDASALLEKMSNPPEGLSAWIINNLMTYGSTKTDPAYAQEMLDTFKSLPDKKPEPPGSNNDPSPK